MRSSTTRLEIATARLGLLGDAAQDTPSKAVQRRELTARIAELEEAVTEERAREPYRD